MKKIITFNSLALFNYLDGFIIPETSLRIWSFVVLVNLIPTIPKASSAMFRATFGRVGRALLPI